MERPDQDIEYLEKALMYPGIREWIIYLERQLATEQGANDKLGAEVERLECELAAAPQLVQIDDVTTDHQVWTGGQWCDVVRNDGRVWYWWDDETDDGYETDFNKQVRAFVVRPKSALPIADRLAKFYSKFSEADESWNASEFADAFLTQFDVSLKVVES
jgi:hypothetical protein